MMYPKIRTPHGKLMAVHNGKTLAYYRRLHVVVECARRLAEERHLLVDGPELEPRSRAERDLADALLALGRPS